MKRLALVILALPLLAMAAFSHASGHATAAPHRPLSLAALRAQGLTIIHMALTNPSRLTSDVSGQMAPQLQQTLQPPPAPGGTATATATATATPVPPTATPTASPTATTPPYPDAISLYQASAVAFSNVTDVHYKTITNAQLVGVVKDAFTATGNANNRQPAYTATVKLSHSVAAGNKVRKATMNFIVIKKTSYAKAPFTHKKWAKVKAKRVCVNFQDQVSGCVGLGNPLPTGTSSGGGSGSGPTLRGLKDLGPAVVAGIPVWHLQGSITDQGFPGTLDFFISRAQYLPVEIAITFDVKSTTPEQKVYEAQILTKFNKTVNIKAPKLGT